MALPDNITSKAFIIRGGRVIDPAQDLDDICDILVHEGKVENVGRNLSTPLNYKEFNAEGCLVTPGLIDSHAHVYEFCTPLGVNPDMYCLSRGVTTVVDAGSAGAGTFGGLQHFIAGQSNTRVLAFLHIAAHGLAASGCSGFGAGGECDSLNQVDVAKCVSCLSNPANQDILCGVKVRLTADVANNGEYEEEAYRRALKAAQAVQLPLMVHHTFSSIPTQENNQNYGKLSCPGSMLPGDIYTHTYHGFPSTIIDAQSCTVLSSVLEAKSRGVLFDVGHGQGSFSWTVAELCAKQGFWPDIISTDLHSGNIDGPVYDLPTVLTKMVHIGMSLYDVIKAATLTPAKALHKDHLIGSLRPGRAADITMLRIEQCDVMLEDSQGQLRKVQSRLVPLAVWKDGKNYNVTKPKQFPNQGILKSLSTPWDQLVIRDTQHP